jgi:phage terminase large subunit
VKELRTYKWKQDKSGKAIDEPVKFNDDGMDAMRYGFFNGINANKNTISWF